jgi:phosphatidylglycerophosphatase A
MSLRNTTISKFFASLFGIGFLPVMPGTFGSAVVLTVFMLPDSSRLYVSFILLILLTLISILTLPQLISKNDSDPSFIVIDEAIGMLIVLLTPFIYFDEVWVVIAFLLFRFFDIVKPYPISVLDNRVGVFYILADDIIAGIISSIFLHILYAGYRALPLVVLYFKNNVFIN